MNSLVAKSRLTLSGRLSGLVVQSEIRAMSIECEKVGGINLAQGVCDTEVPLEVRRAAHQAIDGGVNSYTRFDGIAQLRAAIARKLKTYNHLEADPETQIIVSGGSTGSFYCACLALLDPGDEVILFEPYYGYHVNTLAAVGATAVYAEMTPSDWSIDWAGLENLVTGRTKAIMINTPANPSGKVFSRRELERLADFAESHDLIVFTDEIYEYFLYDGREHVSPAVIPGMSERAVTISGFSKTYGITGWRIGYSVCRPDWARMIGYLNDLVYVCAPAPLQMGVAGGLEQLTDQYYGALQSEYAAKRDLICKTLSRVGLTPHIPQGAYYVLAGISPLPGATGKAKAMHLLEKTGVASVPGEAFFHGAQQDQVVRFCFAKSEADLSEACRRLEKLTS